MRLPIVTSAAVCLCLSVAAEPRQQPPKGAPGGVRAERIGRNLLPAVRVRGRTYIPATIEERMRALGVPAVSIAVINDGRIEWARAYGLADISSRRPATTETLFQAASISKPIAAVAALQLVQERKLPLDEDVNARLTSWKIPPSTFTANKPVTLRRILSHTSGLSGRYLPGYEAGAPLPTVVQALSGAKPANTPPIIVQFEPGSQVQYAGGGFTVMQLLLTDVTGKPFPELLQERVLAPAGMSSSTFLQPLPGAWARRAAAGYDPGPKAIPGRFVTLPEMAAAGLWSTPSDIARWVLALQRAHAGGPSRLLSREMAREMLSRQAENWGLGLLLDGQGDALRFSQSGSIRGFRSQMVGFAARGQGAVVMTNSDAAMPLIDEIVLAIAAEYGWPGVTALEIVPVPVPAERLRDYAGSYGEPDGPISIVAVAGDGTLIATMPTGEKHELIPTGPDAFTNATDGGLIRFEREAGGRVAAATGGGARFARLP